MFKKIPLGITETVAILLSYQKHFTKRDDEVVFRNLHVAITERIKAELSVKELSLQKFHVSFNPCPPKEMVESRFGVGATITHPKYTLMLIDFTNSKMQIFRINIRRKEQSHTNKRAPFDNSPDLIEFENEKIFGSSIAVGKQEESFHIPLDRFEKFTDFNPNDFRLCFAIFAEYANIIAGDAYEHTLFSEFADHL